VSDVALGASIILLSQLPKSPFSYVRSTTENSAPNSKRIAKQSQKTPGNTIDSIETMDSELFEIPCKG
jgi:hypothetical protein